MKYRKKPVVIEAFQWTGKLYAETDPRWFQKAFETGEVWVTGTRLFIKTLEGIHEALIGDWIIQGVKEEIYPCKPDIFELTYELAEDIRPVGKNK